MEMEPTQESTQPYSDPRRMGSHNSGLEEQDLADIICILHPGSPPAHEAVAVTAHFHSQHILQRDDLDEESSSRDIALRLSSPVIDPSVGFCFGRNPQRCDVFLTPEATSKHISNMHFRIFLTNDGILMLQDTSTNGTLVDNSRLWRNSDQSTRMLINGSVIQVASDNRKNKEVRFVVRIPARDGFQVQYTNNLYRYLELVQRHEARTKEKPVRGPLVQTQLHWTVGNPYGMHWSGAPDYNVTGQIGKGAFATVYKLATKRHGAVFAAKELDKQRFMKNGILDQKVDNEMKIMRDLHHPNIVQYVDHHEHEKWIYIIMEYVAGGELSTYLQGHGKIAEDMVKSIARQLLHALQYLHKRKITHRDIKPDNVLIASLDPLRVKLSDFGLSKVVQEETFLKTFCGTLLYCAPEIYPEYDNYRLGAARKRRRLDDPPPRTSPYSQSVDMWSLGAVLYHILCGSPPFIGRGEDRGAHMLRTIMTTEVDLDLLRREGVSEDGIDFVARLLCRDPHLRPGAGECFQHAWISQVPDIDEYPDDEDEFPMESNILDIIQEFNENELIPEEVDEVDEVAASQLSNVSIHDNSEAEEDENISGDGESQIKRPRLEEVQIRYPSLPSIASFPVAPTNQPTTPHRLFGEVTASVLRSSGVLEGINPNAVFGVPNASLTSGRSSSGESMVDVDGQEAVPSFPVPSFGGSASSLLGAESLVGQLKMSSSNSGPSNHSTPAADIPTTPPVRADRKVTPANERLSEANQENLNANDVTPKAIVYHRRIDLPLPDTASESSISRDHESSGNDEKENEIDPAELATTIDAGTGTEVSEIPPTTYRDTGNSFPENAEPTAYLSSTTLSDAAFAKPHPLLGKLVTVPGSVFELSLRLESRLTSWGRGPLATIHYPHRDDTRIPAYALEVTFWSPGIEARIASGADWTAIPDVMAILSTKTRKCIWVNGVELRRSPQLANGREGFNFGKLYTGDIITVYQHRDHFLKFRCEFYHGDSARPRPENEAGFIVRNALMPKPDSNRIQPTMDPRIEKTETRGTSV